MYKDNQLYVAHSAEGPIHIIGKMANRHGLIAGATGTGKTVMAVEKAKRHADNGEKVLFLCYNSFLKDYLQNVLCFLKSTSHFH